MSDVVRALPSAGRLMFNKSIALRHLRNRWRHPGLDCDPSVNFTGEGSIEHAPGASLAAGCNVVVAADARLVLGRHCFVGRQVELGPDTLIAIGDHTSIQDRCIILGNVRIGRYCLLSYDIYISSGNHLFDRRPSALIKDQDREFGSVESLRPDANPVVIEDDVWLGVHVVVMPGITIGRGCVVGANSVVTRSLAPYSVAAGVPARVIRTRLEFVPPGAIDWEKEDDIPYFYRGFETSAEKCRQHARLGGHVASGDFALSLKRGAERKIYIRAWGLPEGEALVASGGRSHPLSDTPAVYEFDDDTPDNDQPMPSVFSVKGGAVVVSNAWTR
jgi:acetyltransferase-like isoleucine patch superfamily enzyme